MPRLFIGVFLPKEHREKVVRIQNILKKLPMKIKLVEPENLHISLTFLGEIPNERIYEIKEKMVQLYQKYKKTKVRVLEPTLIPSKNYIRVIALRVVSKELEEIRQITYKKIGGDSKPLHLTLCRVKSVFDKENIVKKVSEIKNEFDFEVKKISLVESKLTQNGPIYTPIFEIELK